MGQHHSIPNSKKSKGKTSIIKKEIEEKTSATKQGTQAQDPPGYFEQVPQLPPPPAYSPRIPRQNPPLELVLHVARYLDPVSRLCLRYTSRSLFWRLPFNAESELGSRSAGSSRLVSQVRDSGPRAKDGRRAPHYDLKREGRLQLLRHFLKDGLFGDYTSICGACLTVHEDSLFLPVELEKPDAERSCLGLTGKVWVCPHTSLTYEQITLRNPLNTNWECFACTSIHATTPSQSSSRVCFPIKQLLGPSNSIPTKAEIAAALADLGAVSICPHFTLSSLFPEGHLFPNELIGTENQGCTHCPVHYTFDIKPTGRGNGARLLRLAVERDFRSIKGLTDPMWLVQLVQKERVAEESKGKSFYDGERSARWEWKLDTMEEDWRKAEKKCGEVMHVGVGRHESYGRCGGCVEKSRLKD